MKLFSRVGIPDEILTDQGTNFMSALLQGIYRLLHIKRIRTTPYHPQTDGPVERFNGTLKAMLNKLTSRNQKDWDELLPYRLFAYREVPQESTGFAPFELLYGRRVRSQLDVLKEVWTGEEVENVCVAAHVMQMRERLQEMSSIARENLVRAQKKQKRYYDERAKPQALEVGDKVLVLAPTKRSKLQLEWAGPYSVTKQVSPVDYEVETPGRRNTKSIYHVNLLKKWYTPPNSSSLVILQEPPQGEESDGDLEEGDLERYLLPADDQHLATIGSLTTEQQQELRHVLQEFPDVVGEKLGRTTTVQHEIDVKGSTPVR